MSENRIDVRSLVRDFGDVRALDDVSFAVRPGRLTGFVGANGAGKTTTMQIVLGVLSATAGEVTWDGGPLTAELRRRFGYLPEERGLYPKMRVAEQLRYFARLHGTSRAEAERRTDALLRRLELAGRAEEHLENLSLGNQQRVQIAAALLHRPVALVLDEPFSGLDPLAVDVMADLLREEAGRGVPVLLSSHQLELVERLCDDIVILARGRVVAAGTPESLRRAAAPEHVLRMSATAETGWVTQVRGVRLRSVDRTDRESVMVLEVATSAAVQDLLRTALRHGEVRELTRRTPSLAEVFREAVA